MQSYHLAKASGLFRKAAPLLGLAALILGPLAAAAKHASRESLRHILLLVALSAVGAIAVILTIIWVFPYSLIHLTYGPLYAAAVPILRLYAIDEALLAAYLLAVNYLVAIGDYAVFMYLLTAVILEAILMAAFGQTPVRLLSIAISVNALLVPAVWMLAVHSLRSVPHPANPERGEAPVQTPP